MPNYIDLAISNKTWHLLEPHLPGRSGGWGGIARNNRLFIHEVFWIMRALVHHGEICRLTMAVGAIRIVGLFAGETRASGKS